MFVLSWINVQRVPIFIVILTILKYTLEFRVPKPSFHKFKRFGTNLKVLIDG